MSDGSADSSVGGRAGIEREDRAPFDPRPWPLIVVMLAALLGVFFGLRHWVVAAADGGGRESRPSNVATVPSR